MNRKLALGMVLALGVAFGVGVYAGVSERAASAQTFDFLGGGQPSDADFSKLWKVWIVLETSFVETHASATVPSEEERVYGAIRGLTESYGDPYTIFLPPQDAKQFNEDVSGSFGGVGMELGARNGALMIVAPLKGTPAEAAGVRSGDIILAIDGQPSETMAVEDAVKLIRGAVGTSVTITVRRAGEAEPLKIRLTRAVINIPVINAYNRGDGIFVIELYSFSENSPALFRRALRQYFESGSQRLLLDLRGNPGGYLEAAVDMASFFLPVGEPVVTEDFKGRQQNAVHRSFGYNLFANKKLSMAVLVDQGSASASEILAGALSQHGVAKLVGTRTFGKGSVQQLIELGDGAELKVTVARWLTPDGTSISDGGLRPDIQVERTAEQVAAGKDPQKDAAVAWFATQ